ncbi:hypothetical protein WJX81_000669 [Elliptochloris bilobata]|uniref:Protein tweety homolog n=1 Tax=Elliptochloris bilobata TaxID=381761 RepID=A0AAW1SK83_9CHLO
MASRNGTTVSILNIPTCSAVPQSAFDTASAAAFEPTQWSYYRQYLSTVLPGLICGGLCFLAAATFLIWLCTLCCRRLGWVAKAPLTDKGRRGGMLGAAGNAFTVLLALAAAATATWALAESLHATDGRVSEFWGIVTDARGRAQGAVDTASGILGQLDMLQSTLDTISRDLPGLTGGQATGTEVNNSLLQINLPQTAATIRTAVANGRAALAQLNSQGLQAVADFQAKNQPSSENFQNIGRPVVLGTFFGGLMLLTLAAGVLAAVGRTPRLAAFVVIMLWLAAGVVLVIGAGGLLGARGVAGDGCLYGETYALHTVRQRYPASQRAQQAVQYYLGGGSALSGPDILQRVFNVNVTALQAYQSDPEVTLLLRFLATPAGAAAVNATAAIPQADRAAIISLPGLVDATQASLASLEARLERVRLSAPPVAAIKDLVCCELPDGAARSWQAWTVAGALAAMLALLVTVRLAASVAPAPSSQFYTAAPGGTAEGTQLVPRRGGARGAARGATV